MSLNSLRAQMDFGLSQNFAFQVKQVDEFIERFNGDKSTVLIEYMKKYYPEEQMERYELLTTLFDHEDKSWDMELIKDFLRDVNNPEKPRFLSYYDNDWYAQLDCMVEYRGEKQELSLFLEVESSPDLASEWVITGINADFLCLPELEDPRESLNPVSHATDFMNLHQLFEKPEYAQGYMHQGFRGDLLTLFYNALNRKELRLKGIKNISYHFLQLPNWTFTLRRFRRLGLNSGWLIDSLTPMTEAEKANYRIQKLFLH
ncbi:MAG: hypothetical protein AAF696_28635 [Bacteroidota bacterium]